MTENYKAKSSQHCWLPSFLIQEGSVDLSAASGMVILPSVRALVTTRCSR